MHCQNNLPGSTMMSVDGFTYPMWAVVGKGLWVGISLSSISCMLCASCWGSPINWSFRWRYNLPNLALITCWHVEVEGKNCHECDKGIAHRGIDYSSLASSCYIVGLDMWRHREWSNWGRRTTPEHQGTTSCTHDGCSKPTQIQTDMATNFTAGFLGPNSYIICWPFFLSWNCLRDTAIKFCLEVYCCSTWRAPTYSIYNKNMRPSSVHSIYSEYRWVISA